LFEEEDAVVVGELVVVEWTWLLYCFVNLGLCFFGMKPNGKYTKGGFF
jgi:hypothetical protein